MLGYVFVCGYVYVLLVLLVSYLLLIYDFKRSLFRNIYAGTSIIISFSCVSLCMDLSACVMASIKFVFNSPSVSPLLIIPGISRHRPLYPLCPSFSCAQTTVKLAIDYYFFAYFYKNICKLLS
jgi:hypothetical protein